MEQKQQIIIWPKCQGTGKDYQRNKDGSLYLVRGQPLMIMCDYCNGERAVLERVTTEHFLLTPEIIEEEQKEEGFWKKWRKKE